MGYSRKMVGRHFTSLALLLTSVIGSISAYGVQFSGPIPFKYGAQLPSMNHCLDVKQTEDGKVTVTREQGCSCPNLAGRNLPFSGVVQYMSLGPEINVIDENVDLFRKNSIKPTKPTKRPNKPKPSKKPNKPKPSKKPNKGKPGKGKPTKKPGKGKPTKKPGKPTTNKPKPGLKDKVCKIRRDGKEMS